MTWEETINFIRTQSEFKELVELAYFGEDLKLNVERFRQSEEFNETKLLLKKHAPTAKSILDVGSGNGISALAFALEGFEVTVSEPDPSNTVGAGAIKRLKEEYAITNLTIHQQYAEDIKVNNLFDVVYVRQAMHHAYDLSKFVSNLAGLIKPSGLLITVRDHVVYNNDDKKWFLECHPLQRFYGGENAFTVQQYRDAIEGCGLKIVRQLSHFESVINYFPMTREHRETLVKTRQAEYKKGLAAKIGALVRLPYLAESIAFVRGIRDSRVFDERKIPGRMYTFISRKDA